MPTGVGWPERAQAAQAMDALIGRLTQEAQHRPWDTALDNDLDQISRKALQIAEGLPADLRLGIFYAGPGTLWTDLKGFEQTMLGKLVAETQAGDGTIAKRSSERDGDSKKD